jgi:DNA-binding PadR family transcriptional regulator
VLKLNTTSYAILGLLYQRQWSSYDLTQYCRNSILYNCWPRAESYIYKEQKKLAAEGLIEARADKKSSRRTLYVITRKGREALESWLLDATTSGQFSFEYETLVKFLFSDLHRDSACMAYVSNIAQDALDDAKSLLDSAGQLEARMNGVNKRNAYSNVHVLRFLVDLVEIRVRWAKDSAFRIQRLKGKALGCDEIKKEFNQQMQRLHSLLDEEPVLG